MTVDGSLSSFRMCMYVLIVSASRKSLKAEAKFNHRLARKVVPCRCVLRVDKSRFTGSFSL